MVKLQVCLCIHFLSKMKTVLMLYCKNQHTYFAPWTLHHVNLTFCKIKEQKLKTNVIHMHLNYKEVF